jgi:hypothetical protein
MQAGNGTTTRRHAGGDGDSPLAEALRTVGGLELALSFAFACAVAAGSLLLVIAGT